MHTLYSYFNSSAAFRVRIALNLKGLDFHTVAVDLSRGEQHRADFRARNPAGQVPVLEADGHTLTQSLAIIEYLDERHPAPPLLPGDAAERARIRALALTIACEIHPLNNLAVRNFLVEPLGVDEAGRARWIRHWLEQGLATVERLLADDPRTGACCHGDTPTLADCCLVPQVFNARRFQCPLDHLPTVRRVTEHCLALDAFRRAAPAAQPDAR